MSDRSVNLGDSVRGFEGAEHLEPGLRRALEAPAGLVLSGRPRSFSKRGEAWRTICFHVALGVGLGLLFLHPVTMAIYWLEAHPEVPGVASAWDFALYRVVHTFSPMMLPMSGTFGILGAVLGLGAGLYAIALRRKERQLARFAAELGADVRELIRAGEGRRLEFKSSARWDYHKGAGNRELEAAIAKSIAGFMNAGGGTLLLGVDDDGEIVGLEKDFHTLRSKDRDGYERFLVALVATRLGTDVCSLVHVLFHEIEGRDVCRVMVEGSARPVYFADGDRSRFFLRTGNATRELDAAETVRHVTGR